MKKWESPEVENLDVKATESEELGCGILDILGCGNKPGGQCPSKES